MSVRSSRFAYGLGEPLILQQRRRRAPRDWLCGFDIDPPYAAWFSLWALVGISIKESGCASIEAIVKRHGQK